MNTASQNESDYKNQVPPELFDTILTRIAQERTHRSRMRQFRVSLCCLSLFGLLIVPISHAIYTELTLSGFTVFVGTALSGGIPVMQSWKDVGLSLIESFPLTLTIELLAVIFFILVSFKYLMLFRMRHLQ